MKNLINKLCMYSDEHKVFLNRLISCLLVLLLPLFVFSTLTFSSKSSNLGDEINYINVSYYITFALCILVWSFSGLRDILSFKSCKWLLLIHLICSTVLLFFIGLYVFHLTTETMLSEVYSFYSLISMLYLLIHSYNKVSRHDRLMKIELELEQRRLDKLLNDSDSNSDDSSKGSMD